MPTGLRRNPAPDAPIVLCIFAHHTDRNHKADGRRNYLKGLKGDAKKMHQWGLVEYIGSNDNERHSIEDPLLPISVDCSKTSASATFQQWVFVLYSYPDENYMTTPRGTP